MKGGNKESVALVQQLFGGSAQHSIRAAAGGGLIGAAAAARVRSSNLAFASTPGDALGRVARVSVDPQPCRIAGGGMCVSMCVSMCVGVKRYVCKYVCRSKRMSKVCV